MVVLKLENLGVPHLVDSSISCYVSNLRCSCWEIETRNVILLMNTSSSAPSSQQTCCTWKKIAVQLPGPKIHHSKNESEIVSGSTPKPVPFGLPYILHALFSQCLTPKRIHLSSKRNVSISSISSKGLDEPSKAFLGLLPQESRNDENGDTVPPQNLEIGEHRVVNKKPNVKFVKTVLFFPWKSLILEIFYVANQWKKEFAKEIFRTSDLTRQIPSA